jgi:hypothetical protein
MDMDSRATLLVLAACSIPLGCQDPLTPADLAGTYSLTSMDARALPQLLTATITCDQWVDEGDLTLQTNGAFELAVGGEFDCTRGGGPVQANGWIYPGTYSVSGTTLQFVSPVYPSGAVQFTGEIDWLRARVRIRDLELQLSRVVDLDFQRN